MISESSIVGEQPITAELEPLLSCLYQENSLEPSNFVTVDKDFATAPLHTLEDTQEEESDEAEKGRSWSSPPGCQL